MPNWSESLLVPRIWRLLLVALLGPAILTALFITTAFGVLHVLGLHYSPEQILRGSVIFYALWQIAALVWLWRNWKQ